MDLNERELTDAQDTPPDAQAPQKRHKKPTIAEIRAVWTDDMVISTSEIEVETLMSWKKISGLGNGRRHNRVCVGGALCHYMYDTYNEGFFNDVGSFPSVLEFEEALIRVNPALGRGTGGIHALGGYPNAWTDETFACRFADAIITANDSKQFEEAWKIVALALDFNENSTSEELDETLSRTGIKPRARRRYFSETS